MKRPPQELIEAVTEKTFEEFLLCMVQNTDGKEAIERVASIISRELKEFGFPHTPEEAKGLANILGLRFLECLEGEEVAANDEEEFLQ